MRQARADKDTASDRGDTLGARYAALIVRILQRHEPSGSGFGGCQYASRTCLACGVPFPCPDVRIVASLWPSASAGRPAS